MATKRTELETVLTADDNASKIIDGVAKKAERLEDLYPTVEVKADTKDAERDIAGLLKKVDKLGGSKASEILLSSNAEEIGREIIRLTQHLDELDAEDPQVDVDISQLAKLEGELDQVNAKMKELGSTPVEIDTRRATQGLGEVGKSADSSKSVLANMVGNATQDLGVMGGVAGSAGVAIGQMGEYMADAAASGEGFASIARNFAGVAGPIAALSVGVALVTKVYGDMQKANEAVQRASKAAADDIAADFRDIESAADLGAAGVSGFLDSLGASFVKTQETSGRTLGALQELGIGFEDLGATLAKLDQGGAGRTAFFEDFLTNSDKVTGATDDIAGAVARAIVQADSFDSAYNQAIKFGGQAAGEFVKENENIVRALEEIDDAGENISLDQTIKETTDQLLKAQGGLEAFGQAVNELGPDASKLDTLNRALEIYNSLPEAAERWAAANKPLEGMAETWDRAAEAARRVAEGQELTASETADVQRLMDEYGMTTDEVLSKGLERWEEQADAAGDSAEAIEAAKAAAEEYASVLASADWKASGPAAAATAFAALGESQFGLTNVAKDLQAAYDDLDGSIAQNGFTFDLATEAGRGNAEQIQSLYSSLIPALSQAYADAGGSVDKFGANLDTLRGTTMAQLGEQTGLTGEQIQAVVDQLGVFDGTTYSSTFEMLGLEDANTKLALLSGVISGLPEDVQRQVTLAVLAGDPQAALAAIEASVAGAPLSPAVIPVEGDSTGFSAAIRAAEATQATATVDVTADVAAATTTTNAFANTKRAAKPVLVDADVARASANLLNLISQTRTAMILVSLRNWNAVYDELQALVSKQRRAPIDVYLRSYPSAQDIANRIGVVRVPVDAYVRTTPRINGAVP